ncbi:MAG: T9SS type A sorting domain-containing protein, partial [Saprospiraceae bacterium]
ETAITHYEIEHSADGKTFDSIGKVATNGDLNYQFLDKNPVRRENFYRIKEVENSGRFSFSETKLVQLKSTNSTLLVYPNPTAGKVNLQLPVEETENAISTLVDVHGKTVLQQKWSRELDLSVLPSGVYLLQIETTNGNYQQRIVKQQ